MIFDESGKVVASAQEEHTQILPQPGWVEHDALEIWLKVTNVITAALKSAGLAGEDLAAIGITNQRETTVAWDGATGKPLYNAIVWQDTRGQVVLDTFNVEQKSLITHKTGLTIAPYFSGSKISWLLRNVPEVAKAAQAGTLKIGTIDSWLVWNLTKNVHITDVTNASRTLLMDLELLAWDSELLEIFGVPAQSLPSIKSSSEIYAHTNIDGVFGAEVPIAGILGDQHAAMVGQLCFERGDTKCTYGTGNFALVNTGTDIVRSTQGLLTTVCFKFGDEPARYALEGSVAVTGSAVQWLRDQLGIIHQASEIEALAASVPDNGGVYFVPAFSGLFAPYWRSDARGVLVGLTRAATRAHIARATLEAIAYQTKDVIDAMADETGVKLKELRVDGGITSNNLCMQIQSDILQIDLSRPVVSETTALGAAYAAGLAVGIWPNIEALGKQWKESVRWSPADGSALATTGYKNWKRAIERTLNWVE
jgi:glycerol kinase